MDRPNILMVVTDQLSMRFLEDYTVPPTIKAIKDEGLSAERCICQCPLCQPSRASFWSGIYPHKTEVLSNGKRWPVPQIDPAFPTLGNMLTQHGYKAMHFGKKHDAGALAGFWCDEEKEEKIPDDDSRFPYNMDTYADVYTRRRSLEFLSSYGWEKPLCMVVDLINPHNICGWVGVNKGVHVDPPVDDLPPLPKNFTFDDIENRAKSVQYVCCSHIRQSQTVGWTDDAFRHYLAAYRYYLTLVDSYINDILQALKQTGHEEDTIVIFTSDHGDDITARGEVTKQVNLYEECVAVPFFIKGKGIKRGTLPGLMENLDIAPTILSLCGIPVPKEYDGIDLSANFQSGEAIEREYAVSQWHTEWGFTVSPSRMVRTKDAKYIRYLEDGFEEFYDLKADPYEMKNIVRENPPQLAKLRKMMDDYLKKTNDPFETLKVVVPSSSRNHPVGYQNHRGLAAPQL